MHNEVDVSFPDKLKQLRKDAGLSQAKLGKRLGVTRNAVSQWEAGATEPSTKHLRKLAAALGAPLDQLISALPRFRGSKRRQELVGITNGVHVYDDFAHHPIAVRETLEGFRERVEGRLIAVFEPRSATASIMSSWTGLPSSDIK